MFRTHKLLLNGASFRVQHAIRHQSQKSGRGSGAGKAVIAVIGTVGVGFAGAIGYAFWSEDNRKSLDDGVPGMVYITDALLGPVRRGPAPVVNTTPPPFFAATPRPPPAASLHTDRPATHDTKAAVLIASKEMQQETKEQLQAPLPLTVPSPLIAAIDAPTPTPTDSATEAAAGSTTSSLTEAVRHSNRGVSAALDAAEMIQQQVVSVMQAATSSGVDDIVKDAITAATAAAEAALQQAQEAMAALATSVAGSPVEDAGLALAKQTIVELGPAVDRIQAVIRDSVTTIGNIELLSAGLQQCRSTLLAELQTALPAVPATDAEQLLVGHAYNKMAQLQALVADKQQLLDELRARGGAVEEGGGGGITESEMQGELDKLRHLLTLQHRSDLGRQQEELEAEVRGQLKRQAAAHADHVSDVLTKQEHDLNTSWQGKLYDHVNKEKDRHYKDIASIRGKLLGLQAVVSARADADRAARAARELFLACQALRNAVRLGRAGASTWDGQLQPLQGNLAAITNTAAGTDEFVSSVVGTVGSVAATRGVYTEQALRHRFERVATIARRVAMVPENGGSLVKYLLSYLQSMLLVQATPLPTDTELLDQPVDIHNVSTFDIIDRARECLTADDMVGCVRWLNQLTGESRKVAQDWCTEARRTLELQQVAEVLMAHAAATTATAL